MKFCFATLTNQYGYRKKDGKMTEKTEKQARYEYIDLLTSALTDHERRLSTLIERLDKVVNELSTLTKPEPSQQTEKQQIGKKDDQPEEDINSLLKTARNMLYNK